MSLRRVRRFRITEEAVGATVDAIRSAGEEGYELFVIWSGTRDGNVFTVAEVHIPDQVSYKMGGGLCVRIDGSELHRLNVWLYEAQQVVGAQVHSHPRDAYHSDTDNAYPVATLDGSLSLVLPYFGRDGWESREIAAYRLGRDGWYRVRVPLSDLVEVVGDGAS